MYNITKYIIKIYTKHIVKHRMKLPQGQFEIAPCTIAQHSYMHETNEI